MKKIFVVIVALLSLSGFCLTDFEKGQVKRMSAKYASDPKSFFDHKVQVVTLLVKCHATKIVSGIGLKGRGQNQAFACLSDGADKSRRFFAYAKTSSRVCKELVKYCSENAGEGDCECYLMLERPTVDVITLDEDLRPIRKTVNACWIKEFMPKDKYESGMPKDNANKRAPSSSSNTPVSLPTFSNSVSIAMFRADKMSGPVRYVAKAKLSDFFIYNYDNCEETHWSIDLRCKDSYGNKDDFCGYVLRVGELGKKVKHLLEDGKEHFVEIVLAHPKKAQSGICCDVLLIEECDSSKWGGR